MDDGMSKGYLCLKCMHYLVEQIKGQYVSVSSVEMWWMKPITVYSCKATGKAIRTLRTKCSNYIPHTQKRLKVVINGMVKIEDIPSEGERIELTDLPQEVELLAISEKITDAVDGKAGGLVIKFQVRDGRSFDQKYTKLSGHVLYQAMKKLKISDTETLQKVWYHYDLTPMRMGFPRMIPIKKAKEQ